MGGRPLDALISSAAIAARSALDFLVPPVCCSCDRPLDEGDCGLACARCWTRIALLHHPQCERCGHPGLDGSCRWCEILPPFVHGARSYCWTHRGTGSAIVHSLKYRGWHALADEIAGRMSRMSPRASPGVRRIVVACVPLADSRLRERGYNQSELLARGLARRWKAPLALDLLERTRATETQTRLTREERQANVSDAFRVPDSARKSLRDAHVLIVDDVVTTAATLNACATALHAGGAEFISYMTFGRAPAVGDR